MNLEEELLKLGAEKMPYEDDLKHYYIKLEITKSTMYLYEPDTGIGYMEITEEYETTDIEEVKRIMKAYKK